MSGRAVYTVPRTLVSHRVKKRGFRFVHQQIRNRWLLILVTYSWRSIVTLLPAFLIDECALIASLMVQGKLTDCLAANCDVVRGLPVILAKRRQVQTLKRRRDRDSSAGAS